QPRLLCHLYDSYSGLDHAGNLAQQAFRRGVRLRSLPGQAGHLCGSEYHLFSRSFALSIQETQLAGRGVTALAGVTGDSPDPTAAAWRFSPGSNDIKYRMGDALEAEAADESG
ncbi:MAG: hypothetical protein WBV59_08245, partial [Anaerolineae bacterium]